MKMQLKKVIGDGVDFHGLKLSGCFQEGIIDDSYHDSNSYCQWLVNIIINLKLISFVQKSV